MAAPTPGLASRPSRTVYGHRFPDGPTGRIVVLIRGTDYAGWTMEDYVIPRLASGLLWATEVVR